MQTNPLKDTIEDIEQFKENLQNAAKESEDIKNGESTVEEEQSSPEYILFNGIADTSVEILKLPTIQNAVQNFSKLLGPDFARQLIEVITIAMTNSAYSALMLYDNLLKDELQSHFDEFSVAINDNAGILNGLSSAMEVFKTRLGKIENDNIKKSVSESINN